MVRGPVGVLDRRPPARPRASARRRVIGSPATAKVIPDRSRSAPTAGVGRGTRGWSEPRRGWRLEHVEPERARQVDDRGGRPPGRPRPATRPTWSSGVAMTSRSTPAAAAATGVAATERAPRLEAPHRVERRHQRPAGPARSDDTECGHETPFDVPAPRGCRSRQRILVLRLTVYPRRRPRHQRRPGRPRRPGPGPARPGGPARTGARASGVGHGQLGVVEGHPVDPQHVGVEGPRAPPDGPHPAGGRLQPAALLEQPVGVGAGGHGQLHHHVEVGPLALGAAHGLGLVHPGHRGHRRPVPRPELVDGPAEVGPPVARGWSPAPGRPAPSGGPVGRCGHRSPGDPDPDGGDVHGQRGLQLAEVHGHRGDPGVEARTASATAPASASSSWKEADPTRPRPRVSATAA